MKTWPDFTTTEPRLASTVRSLFYHYGPGLGYLATVRADGGPRINPISPVITDEGLFCFLLNSPKRRDLERDGRYALHSYPPEDSDDEACLTGTAGAVRDPHRISHVMSVARATPSIDWRLFELTIETATVLRRPQYIMSSGVSLPLSRQVWRA